MGPMCIIQSNQAFYLQALSFYASGHSYRKVGKDDCSDRRFRKVLAKACGYDISDGLPDLVTVITA